MLVTHLLATDFISLSEKLHQINNAELKCREVAELEVTRNLLCKSRGSEFPLSVKVQHINVPLRRSKLPLHLRCAKKIDFTDALFPIPHSSNLYNHP